jgi:hypothetical protein
MELAIGVILLIGISFWLGWQFRRTWEDHKQETKTLIDKEKCNELEVIHHTDNLDVYECINCGALADDDPDLIVHYKTCKKGESKKWEKFYDQEGIDNAKD